MGYGHSEPGCGVYLVDALISTPLQSGDALVIGVDILWRRCRVEIIVLNLLMMDRWVMLGEVISKVGCSTSPVHMELALINSILEPVKLHVHSF